MKRWISMALAALLALAGITFILVPAAQAASMSACYIGAFGPDHHVGWRHGHVIASVDYTWAEEVFLGQRDGYKFFGITSADKIDTRPWWIHGC